MRGKSCSLLSDRLKKEITHLTKILREAKNNNFSTKSKMAEMNHVRSPSLKITQNSLIKENLSKWDMNNQNFQTPHKKNLLNISQTQKECKSVEKLKNSSKYVEGQKLIFNNQVSGIKSLMEESRNKIISIKEHLSKQKEICHKIRAEKKKLIDQAKAKVSGESNKSFISKTEKWKSTKSRNSSTETKLNQTVLSRNNKISNCISVSISQNKPCTILTLKKENELLKKQIDDLKWEMTFKNENYKKTNIENKKLNEEKYNLFSDTYEWKKIWSSLESVSRKIDTLKIKDEYNLKRENFRAQGHSQILNQNIQFAESKSTKSRLKNGRALLGSKFTMNNSSTLSEIKEIIRNLKNK